MAYGIKEIAHYENADGFRISINQVPGAGFRRVVAGYAVTMNGNRLYHSVAGANIFATREAAEAALGIVEENGPAAILELAA